MAAAAVVDDGGGALAPVCDDVGADALADGMALGRAVVAGGPRSRALHP